jgi:hypothetical protein
LLRPDLFPPRHWGRKEVAVFARISLRRESFMTLVCFCQQLTANMLPAVSTIDLGKNELKDREF